MAVFHQKIILGFSILFTIATYTQKQLVVYQVKGDVKFKQTKKQLYLGTLVDNKSSIIIEKGSAILLDEKSNMYKVSKNGTLSFIDIKKNKIESNTKSVSKRYLSYVYKRFLNLEEKESIYGGVFRGNNILNTPENGSYFTQNSFVAFNWKSTGEKEFYIWILDTKKNSIVGKYKLEYANSLSLLLPFKKGVYKWAVTTDNAVDEKTTFNYFEIVSKKEFSKRKEDPIYEAKKEIDLIL